MVDAAGPALGPAHPGRRVLRTILANLGAFAVTVPIVIAAIGIPENAPRWVIAGVAGVVAVSAAITRVLAIPQVEQFLQRSVSWLAAGDTAVENVVAVVSDNTVVAGPASPITTGQPVEVFKEGEMEDAVAVAVEEAIPAPVEAVPPIDEGDSFPSLYNQETPVEVEYLGGGDEGDDEEVDENK